jgi:hypothetical protein
MEKETINPLGRFLLELEHVTIFRDGKVIKKVFETEFEE